MSPEGYRAPRRHYPTIRQDAYEGTIGLKGDYMREGATRAQMNRAEAEYRDYNDRIEAAENAGEILDGVITVDWRSNYEGDQAKATLSTGTSTPTATPAGRPTRAAGRAEADTTRSPPRSPTP